MSFGYKTQFQRHDGSTFVQVAGLISIEENEINRPSVQTTNMDDTDGYHSYQPSPLADAGEFNITLEWDQADTEQTALKVDLNSANLVQYRVVYPDATTVTFNGFITNWGKAVPMEDRITRTLTFKISGEPTVA